MDVFNYIVGSFSILSAVTTVISVLYLKKIANNTTNTNSGEKGVIAKQSNRGKNGTNTMTTIAGDINGKAK